MEEYELAPRPEGIRRPDSCYWLGHGHRGLQSVTEGV